MSKRVIKKISPEYFQAILDGQKKYELRLNDFEIEAGDILVLEEYTSSDPETRKQTGRKLEKEVIYLRKFKLSELQTALRCTSEELEEIGVQVISFN
jgi:ASC-1-like (ASCH) protein